MDTDIDINKSKRKKPTRGVSLPRRRCLGRAGVSHRQRRPARRPQRQARLLSGEERDRRGFGSTHLRGGQRVGSHLDRTVLPRPREDAALRHPGRRD